MKNAIEIKKLKKVYQNFTLGELDLELPEGQIIGLIGENGAGKTTLIKSILGIIKPSEGDIKVFGSDLKLQEDTIKENIGVVLDDMFFPEPLTVKDIASVMKSIYKNWDDSYFQKYITKFQLPEKSKIKTFSKGMRKKLEIITSLAHHPKLLILDEPTSGLDPVVRNEILDLFLDFIQDEQHTILFSTHITSDLERIADHIILVNHGLIELNENKDELLENYGILKCSQEELKKIKSDNIIRYKENKYNCEALIKNKDIVKKQYPDFIIDKITLDDLMILYLKGESL